MSSQPQTTREHIMSEALRLFGVQGFAATSVAQIEKAAGLSGGSGALYRHFRSKDELLVTAVEWRLADRGDWAMFLEPGFSIAPLLAEAGPDRLAQLTALCRIGLDRLEHDRDVNRILLRDNTVPAELLDVFRRVEYDMVMSVVTRALAELAGPERAQQDWHDTAAVLVGAVAHFWLISDAFDGAHPAGLDADRYLRSAAELILARLD
ncbi:TetR family transcriptional regulator [Nocardia tenerifensis]|uniref:TetR family transcriptional regulator n=1 Tax=Nocardia tenerifensis TaxID=228006 RepID=A0A318KAI1_9NOCA|nr:TetR family transcriptional regulator [Nocardia tenerifensis]PXX70877.1 TetR family transcriptional regulator [Nocardia tenerifensis]